MTEIIMVSDIVEANGKTVRENNLERGHNIALGSLVEVHYDRWHGGGCCEVVHARLWVVHLGRDCDGTPLYWLGHLRHDNEVFAAFKNQPLLAGFLMHGGFGEESLKVIEVTEAIKRGDNTLEGADDLHASAPDGMKCADCAMDSEPCPACHQVAWDRRHPETAKARREQAVEALARYAHDEAWSGWTRYLFKQCEEERPVGDVRMILPEWATDRWRRQMNTSYVELPESEKESYRKEARRILEILEALR